MASKVEKVEVLPDGIIVFVSHLDTDSFSRSVNRVSNKAWRETIRQGRYGNGSPINHTSGRYAHTDLGDRYWMSTIVYSYSWDNALNILERLHGPQS